MFEKNASTQYPISELLARRWSGRAYNPARGLTQQQIITLLEAARWSPSCFGDEPWRMLVCNRDTDAPAWEQALECLTEKNRSWAKNAPVLIVICAHSMFSGKDKQNRWGQYDAGAAAMSLSIQATEMGMMVHQMGGFDADKIWAAFNIPEDMTVMAVMAIGYQVLIDDVPDDLKEREFAGRKRKPLGESFYNGTWGKPVTG